MAYEISLIVYCTNKDCDESTEIEVTETVAAVPSWDARYASENLRRHGWEGPLEDALCPFCLGEMEDEEE